MSMRLSAEEIELVREWSMAEDYADWMRLSRWLYEDAPLSGSITFGDYMLLANIAQKRARELLEAEDSRDSDEDFRLFTGFIIAFAVTVMVVLISMLMWML